MRVGVTGASGMLGTELVTHLSKIHKVFATSRNKGVEGKNIEWDCFDLTDSTLLNEWLYKTKPDIVVHCAAIVDVDLCEQDINLSVKLHVDTTSVIANYLNHNNARLIYISTDSVFDGKKRGPYSESDLEGPLNVYARTKLMGENLTKSMSNGLVLRTNIVGWPPKGGASFVQWVFDGLTSNTQLNLFHDVCFSPLSTYDLTLIIGKIIENPIFGLYHCASRDSISKYNFGKEMAKVFKLSDSNINKVSLDSIDFKAKRPKNMMLSIDKINLFLEYSFPNAIDSIKSIKHQYKERDKFSK